MVGIHGLAISAFIITLTLAFTYLYAFRIAVKHPNKRRRADARRVLERHRLSRRR
jgi:hypothetical protein